MKPMDTEKQRRLCIVLLGNSITVWMQQAADLVTRNFKVYSKIESIDFAGIL